MSRAERKRLEEFSRMKSGNLTLVQASELLGLSYRHTQRFAPESSRSIKSAASEHDHLRCALPILLPFPAACFPADS